MTRKYLTAGMLCIVIPVVGALAWLCLVKPIWLTRNHESEMRLAILHYEEIVWSQEACFDPFLLAEVSTGAELGFRQSFRSSSQRCYIFEQPRVQIIRVSEYSPACARVVAETWHVHSYQLDLDTLGVITGTDYTSLQPGTDLMIMYILVREGNSADWKVAYCLPLYERLQMDEWLDLPTCRYIPAIYE
jgi:hypothetical protein